MEAWEGVDDVADDNEDQGLLSLTTEIVASFVGNIRWRSAICPP